MYNEKRKLSYQTILNASLDIFILKDAEGRWIEVNERTLEIFGIDETSYKGRTDIELGELYPHFQQYVQPFLQSDLQAWESQKQVQAEEIVIVDGVEHIYNVIKVPIYDSEGNRNSIVVVGRDITELLKNKQWYKTLFYDHPDGVYSLDVEGNFLDVNKVIEMISGYKRE